MSTEWREFHGVNAAYVLELYEQFRRDPHAVDPATRAFFAEHPPAREALTSPAARPAAERFRQDSECW